MHRLSGKEVVKKSTADDILALLYAKGAMSRKDIASVLNLSRATLTVLSSRLIEQGLLIEKGKKAQENGAGRREILLDINVCYQYVMAVIIESSQAVITVCNLKASPIDQNKILLTNNLKPKELLSLIAHQCQRMLKHHDIALSQLLGLGFSLPGFVNRQRGTSMHCHALWQDEVDVRGVMEDLMGCSVIIENNIKSFAEGELLYGLGRTASNILFIKWGPGVGATMVINGRLYEGGYSKTMDLAHYIVDDRENSCWCGRIGCLEALVSVYTLFTKIRGLYSEQKTPHLFKQSGGNINSLTNDFLHDWLGTLEETPLDQLDPSIHLLLKQSIAYLALAVVNSATMLASSHIILLGSMLQNRGIRTSFIEHFQLINQGYYLGLIEQSPLNNQRLYIGGVAIIVREYFLKLGL